MGFLEILESKVVIDNTKVQKLREKIFIENPLMTNEERSRRLIREIHTIINDELTGIERNYISKIRTLLLHRSIKDNNILITYSDIIDSLAEMNLSLEEMIESVKKWYDLHLRGSDIALIDLIDYIKSIQAFYNTGVEHTDAQQDSENTIDETQVIELPDQGDKNVSLGSAIVVIVGIVALALFIFLSTPDKETADTADLNRQAPLVIETIQSTISFSNIQEILNSDTVEHGLFNESINYHIALEQPGIPGYLNYHKIDLIGLRTYLESKNSILAETPYFEGILKVSKEYDVHPLLMFAITGQEQGYVNKNNPNHLKIANNPFNVYTSWRKYNTDIEDSTAIAAGTVVTILRKRPARENPFKWINTRYAEDKNWARGVEMIFNFLLKYEL